MEEMNKEIMENGTVEMVEEVTDKLTFGENCLSYGLATVFGIGVVTVGYLGYKGVKAAAKIIKSKKKNTEASEEEIVNIENSNIQDVDDNDTEKE